MPSWLSILVGSVAGGLTRYGVFRLVSAQTAPGFPYGTVIVNLTGCFLVGVFHAWAEHRGGLSSETRLLLITGFCGAYTTFSALILETSDLIRGNHLDRALLYVAMSIVLGFLFFRLGEGIGKGVSGL